MRCPNCERPLSVNNLRCRVCGQKLIWFYLVIFISILGALIAFIYLIEIYSTR